MHIPHQLVCFTGKQKKKKKKINSRDSSSFSLKKYSLNTAIATEELSHNKANPQHQNQILIQSSSLSLIFTYMDIQL